MAVWITFQSPDWNQDRWTVPFTDEQPSIRVEGYDLDHSNMSVYPRDEEMDINLTLARMAEYMNESGDECGKIGWIIQPDQELLDKMPELQEHVGKRYGRIIVTAVSLEENMAQQIADREALERQEREQDIRNARDAARKSLTHYETLLDVQSSIDRGNEGERQHHFASLIQVRSAKRVLWMEN